MAAPVDHFQLVGHDLVGRFHIERVVAEGGFGVVYRGTQLGLERPVAVKVLKVNDGVLRAQTFVDAFRREAVTVAKLDHPAIVQVLDLGATVMPSGVEAPFMVLQWIEGRSLESIQRKRRGRGGRTPDECLALLRDVFDAVDIAHKAGIAHRDLKPLNIMVSEGPRSFKCSLLDFGIARVMEHSYEAPLTGETRTVADGAGSSYSPRYASPEQISGARTGPWTDVHALALIVVELLIDATAYSSKDITSLYREVLDARRPTPLTFGLEVGAWEPVLARALAAHPGERYASAGDLRDALVATVGDAAHTRLSQVPPVPEEAPDAAPAEHVTRSTSTPAVSMPPAAPARRKTPALAIAAVAASSVGLLTFTLWAMLGGSARPTSTTPVRAAVNVTTHAMLHDDDDAAARATVDVVPVVAVSAPPDAEVAPAVPQSVPATTARRGARVRRPATAVPDDDLPVQ